MRIDYDMIRNLLIKIEDISDGDTDFYLAYFYDSQGEKDRIKIRYHLKYLADAGLIECTDTRDAIIDITPYGRNYLYSVLDASIWEKTKKKIQPLGSVTLSTVVQVASSFILKELGL